MKYFPNNTLTEYTTHLAKEIKLQGEWEVGLAEIQYTHEWENIRETDEPHFSWSNDDGEKASGKLPPGIYRTIHNLLFAIERVSFKASNLIEPFRASFRVTYPGGRVRDLK